MNRELVVNNIIQGLGLAELIKNEDKYISATLRNTSYIGDIMTYMDQSGYEVMETSFDNKESIYLIIFKK